jgi:FHA domain
MKELWLKFTDENGDYRRVLVDRKTFVIGRHSDNDLCIPNAKLSRQHSEIESFDDTFTVTDLDSSNGTFLNGEDLRDPTTLQNGDELDLGGGIRISVEIAFNEPKAQKSNNNIPVESSKSSATPAKQTAATSNNSAIPTSVFIIAPILGIMILVCGGGLLFILGGSGGGNNGKNNDVVTYYPTPDDTPEKTNSPTPKPSSSVTNSPTSVSPSPEETSPESPPEVSNDSKKVEQNSATFLQRIALNDPSAFLKTAEIEAVNSKIAQFKGSSNLAENLKAVKSNASQFESLAQSKGLKAQFLAVAALTEIGNNRGNPLEVAKTMLPILGNLRISLANNLADDNLMMIAAYDQGKAGKFKDLRNFLEALAKKNPGVSPREIRTIWFLKKQNKLTDSEYDYALRFLAIGTITQNPKDFNVNAEAVKF